MIIEALGTSLVFGTALAVVAWVLSITLLRRARPAVLAAMWTVVLLKFLVPVGPGSRYSLASLVDGLTRDTPAAEITIVTAPPADAVLAPRAASSVSLGDVAATTGTILWLAIAAALTVRQVRRARAARRRALDADAAPSWLVEETAGLARRLRIRTNVEVRVSTVDSAPYLVGLVRPIIVMPAALDETARRAALAHELAHVRRGDALLRLVQAAAATLFFFWPIVRLVNRRLDLAREQACDAWAVAVGPLSATDYARMLVDAARGHAAPAAGLALARRGGHLRRRVDALCERPPGAGVGITGVAVIGAFALLGLTGAAPASATSARASKVCLFTPQVASSIMASFPQADLDGDGLLSRTEACEFQQGLRRRLVEDPINTALTSTAETEVLASEQLCCDRPEPAIATCSPGVE
jgi:beta-lactamase regulating signal transducer with metallopeptidase domain